MAAITTTKAGTNDQLFMSSNIVIVTCSNLDWWGTSCL